jgi:hypothetical protein
MARWSNVIDAARFKASRRPCSATQPALRIARADRRARPDWVDTLVRRDDRAGPDAGRARPDVEKAYQRASRNRDRALEQFPPTVTWNATACVLYDASTDKIRRERFAAFYHHPDIALLRGRDPDALGLPRDRRREPLEPALAAAHVGELMERYGGGGHKAVGGANPPSLEDARRVAGEVAETLRATLTLRR